VAVGNHGPVDVQDAPVRPDVKRPAGCCPSSAGKHTVCLRNPLRGIAEDRVLEFEHLRHFPVPLFRIDARLEERHVERPNLLNARTGRITFARSGFRVGLGEPGDYHRPHATVIREAVRLAV